VSESPVRITTRRWTPRPPTNPGTADSTRVGDTWTQLVELSRRANALQRQLQQAQCKNESFAPATDTGAWCRRAVASLHLTDKPLAAALAELFRGKTVLSLGEGQGVYRALVLNASSTVQLSVPTPLLRSKVKIKLGYIIVRSKA